VPAQARELWVPGGEWQRVGPAFPQLAGLTANARGDLFFNDLHGSKTYALFARAEPREPESFVEESGGAAGQAFGPDGRLYAAAAGEKKIVAYTRDEAMEIVAEGIVGSDLVVRRDGKIFVSERGKPGGADGKIWLLHAGRDPRVVASGLKACSGLAFSPEELVLYVADSADAAVYAFTVDPQGELSHRVRFASLPGSGPVEGGIGIAVSRDGLVFVPTPAGIHVFERSGKPAGVIPTPDSQTTDLAFAGAHGDELFIAAGGKLFKRVLRVRGAGGGR
jgi:sugar lactone lactonase YvrE